MKSIVFASIAFLPLFLLASTAEASLYLQNFQAARHDRFYSGGDKAFIGEGYDFSGVGITQVAGGGPNNGYWVTMISPTYFLTAAHYSPPVGSTVKFYTDNTSSNPLEYTVENEYFTTQCDGYYSDLRLGKLTTAIDTTQIAYYPILSLDAQSDYDGLDLFVVGKGAATPDRRADRVGLNEIDQIGIAIERNSENQIVKKTMAMEYGYDTLGFGGDESYLISGDSGGPSFVVTDGALALIGIHYYNSSHNPPILDVSYSGDSFVPYYISQLNANMGSEHLTLVPEPSIAILLVGAAVFLLYYRRLRR